MCGRRAQQISIRGRPRIDNYHHRNDDHLEAHSRVAEGAWETFILLCRASVICTSFWDCWAVFLGRHIGMHARMLDDCRRRKLAWASFRFYACSCTIKRFPTSVIHAGAIVCIRIVNQETACRWIDRESLEMKLIVWWDTPANVVGKRQQLTTSLHRHVLYGGKNRISRLCVWFPQEQSYHRRAEKVTWVK